jgi:hypothetical protein
MIPTYFPTFLTDYAYILSLLILTGAWWAVTKIKSLIWRKR